MKTINKILLLGSGALKIGQAGEFDYSGSQALKALKEEGIKSVLVNPNIATIQTSKKLADKIYFLPITFDFIKKVIEKERPDGVFLGFGGQTALNCGLELYEKGVFKKFNVEVLGTQIKTIKETEDRAIFIKKLKEIDLLTPQSCLAVNEKQAIEAIKKIGCPSILRVGFCLGGLGSTVVRNQSEFIPAVKKALSKSSQVLIEEYLGGFKEIEFEVVRDKEDNCVTVCAMENIDPMGIHTGESIVIAPTQTLNNNEYHFLRQTAIKTIRHLKIVGECNIQFAVNPKQFAYRIIEVNARLSRSSALASKATGYPLAFVAAKLALGKNLFQIKNSITRATTAFFEPALDYVVIKYPRWDLDKFQKVKWEIGSEMKSVGEVMAIARNFQEALQKAIRMLSQDHEGLINQTTLNFTKFSKKEIIVKLKIPTPERLFLAAAAMLKNISLMTINKATNIDMFFLEEMQKICQFYQTLKKNKSLNTKILSQAKILGFSDFQLARIFKLSFNNFRAKRIKYGIIPHIKQIDTLAAEFPAKANYLYLTYQADNSNFTKTTKPGKKAIIIGSGPYCIGSSVEFDWCAVNAALALKENGYKTIMINCNPETVSTDFDFASKLYFEELTLERILDIYTLEKADFIVVSFGGQIANNLAKKLSQLKVKILGTKAEFIDKSENRKKFSRILDKLRVDQPDWENISQERKAIVYANKIGYPVLVRPSYVLSGAAMFVAYHDNDLKYLLKRSFKVSKDNPLVISKFIKEAKEIEVDGIGQNGRLLDFVIGEHIEPAGVHSGDATIVIPAQRIYLETVKKIKIAVEKIVKALNINGPFNIQFIALESKIFVIECNLRASRSFPFASKVMGRNLVELAINAMLNKKINHQINNLDLDYVGVKSPQFSFNRLEGADPVLRVEMSSTGEAACLGNNLHEAFIKSLISVDFKLPKKNILLSLGGDSNKINFLTSLKILKNLGFKLMATEKTHLFLKKHQIKSQKVFKEYENKKPSVLTMIKNKKVDLVINLSHIPNALIKKEVIKKEITDGYLIRRAAADFHVSLLTNLFQAKLLIQALNKITFKDLEVKPWDYYAKNLF